MGLFGWIFSHKLLILFIAATTAFGIATVIVAVEKTDLKEDLEACKSGATEPTEPPGFTTTEAPKMEDWRLPDHVVPKMYDLTLYPDLKTGLFKGAVIATIEVQQDSIEIRVHSNGLKVDEVLIDGKKANNEVNKKFELLIITLADGGVIEKGERVVTIKYNGDMRNRIVGLYNSTYTNGIGEKRAIATSKFEPTYARQAFPCFDEPNMKAKYKVHILKPKDDSKYIALSNMPQEGAETEEENGVMVHFQESVKMSTYLTCFIVCDFDFKQMNIELGGGVPLRVYATPAQVEKTTYALTTAKGVIEFFWKYFDIAYPLPKLDLIAIPDFVSGAMEHWGLVTFRETALLYDEARSSTANKQRIATVVAHELAHSWFGNFVTMKWWNDLWLNEGFASYIEYKGVNAVHADWEMLDQFLIEDLHSVLSLDATPASHPIVQTVVTPDQITEIFDTITYNKGASLLRMLEGAVGDETFQKGVTAYLNKHEWGNAETQDLWDELQKIVGLSRNVTTFMDTWTIQMGYPILTVKDEGDYYTLTQKRFLKDSESPGETKSSYGYKWTVPVTYITDKDQKNTQLVWFDFDKESIKIEKKDTNWIKFNHKQVGYYRVNYPAALWKLLADNIKLFTISDKTHLLEESFSIAESSDGLLGYNVPLDLTKYLKDEDNYIPWSVASTKLEQLRKYLINSIDYSKYLDYVASIVKPAYEKVTWKEGTDDTHLQRRARITILGLACSIGIPECRNEASERFQKWLDDPVNNPLSQDLRTIVYIYGMKERGKNEWEKLLDIFIKEIDANEKLNLMRGLASVKEPWLLRRLIELGIDESIIRSQDYFSMLQYISANPVGTLMVWDYVRENWPYLSERFGLNDRYLGRLIPAITSSFTTKTKLKEMEDFFEMYSEAGAGAAARKEALTNVNNNINWIARNQQTVIDWIKENTITTPPSK